MSKFVPRPKLSKKARKELDAQKRTTWAFSPVTKKVESKKIYNRKKAAHVWKDDSSMSGFLLHWGWYRGERRPWQHLNHVTGLQGGSTEPGCRIFLFVWYIRTQYRLVIHAVLCYNMLSSMYNYTLAIKGAGIVIKNNVGIERKVMWIEAGTIQTKLTQGINATPAYVNRMIQQKKLLSTKTLSI